MQTSNRCPKCHCTQILVIERVAQGYDGNNSEGLLRVHVVRKRMYEEVGHFTAYICTRCRYTEWYAQEFDKLLELANRVPGVYLLGAPKPPYR